MLTFVRRNIVVSESMTLTFSQGLSPMNQLATDQLKNSLIGPSGSRCPIDLRFIHKVKNEFKS